jgi:superfamily II RNA helicase
LLVLLVLLLHVFVAALLSELMFNGCFHNLDKHQLLALVSCLTPTDKTNEEVALERKLAEPLKQLQVKRLSIKLCCNTFRQDVKMLEGPFFAALNSVQPIYTIQMYLQQLQDRQ